MNRLKTALRVAGITLAAVGLMFLPLRNTVFDKRDLSTFHNWADHSAFTGPGVWLILAGGVLVGLSFLVRGNLTD